MNPKIIAFTGTHGVGKTTAAYQGAARVKVQFPEKTVGLLTDIEARCPYPINRGCNEKALEWIFFNKMAAELDLAAQFDLIVTDRTLFDVIAYTYYSGFKALADDMTAVSGRHMGLYQSIRFLRAASFSYNYEDGIRDTDPDFRQAVEDILFTLYHRAGITGQERFSEV